ncbi:MAG TPA: hypothetical protein VNA30_04920 [Mycobacteriales bacterium]|nr:hypothetical protein [Mycobacteriales bacterium]
MSKRGPSAGTIVGSLLVLVAFGLCARLGWWQWERALETNGFRNYVYAAEWWLFGLVGVAGWVKIVLDDKRSPAEPVPPPPPARVGADDPDLDDETRAYNAYLARRAASTQK